MTRDDIMRMAAEAGVSPVNEQQIKFEGPMWLCLERFAALVAAAEREACAAICESSTWSDEGKYFAGKIRERSST